MSVLAIVGRGDDLHRAVAVAFAEAGAEGIALATLEPDQQQEYSVHSIANEIWAIGPEQHVAVLDASDASAIATFLAGAASRLGPVQAIIGLAGSGHDMELTELPFAQGGDARLLVAVDAAPPVGAEGHGLTGLTGDNEPVSGPQRLQGDPAAIASALVKLLTA